MHHYRHLGHHAAITPDKLALVRADGGEAITYAELDARSNRLAWLLHAQGLRCGDEVAALLGHDLRMVDVAWAVLRSGLSLTALPSAANDCDARVLVASFALRDQADRLAERLPYCELRLMAGGCAPGWDAYEDAVATQPPTPLPVQWLGALERLPWTGHRLDDGIDAARAARLDRLGLDEHAVALTAPPGLRPDALARLVDLQFCGATAVVLDAGDAARTQAAVARHGVTHILPACDAPASLPRKPQEFP